MNCGCARRKNCRALLAIGVVLAAMGVPAWGQWSGTNPVWTNSNVGIGTTTAPSKPLTVIAPASGDAVTYFGNSGGYGVAVGWHGLSYGVIQATQPGVTNNTNLALNAFGGNVGIGTTNPQCKLAVNGKIGAKDTIVTNTGWSDYVFRPGYRLRSLSDVSGYIQANGHLPDIPTEAEVKEKGVSVADMQAKLLAKVEELTLHMIQQENKNLELRENLTRENQDLRERLARLEKGARTDSTSAVAK